MQKKKEELIIIKENKDIDALIAYLADKEYIAYDVETVSVEIGTEIIGFSFCAEETKAYYVIIAYWDVEAKELKYLETKERAAEVVATLVGKKLIMHNAPFDCARTQENYGVELMPSLFVDTMILAHLLDENRLVGLKDLGAFYYGGDTRKEQNAMKESVAKNGGVLTKKLYELYKADADLIAYYGAKDTIITFKLLYTLIPVLYEDGMDAFFFDDESMPLLRGPTYELNTTGLKVDVERLQSLKKELEIDMLQLKEYIYKEIAPHIKAKYPATNKKNTFNIGSGNQVAWLLFHQLDNLFIKVSSAGQELARALEMKTPYSNKQKRAFIGGCVENKDQIWREAGGWDYKNKKPFTKAKVKDYWCYLSTDRPTLTKFAVKYKWVEALLEYKKISKLLSTYVEGIERGMRYGIIHPSFLQHGTTSGRYSSRKPNFQNLPRDDKRVKACIIARPGKVLVGADYSQLEPRVFASYSQDQRLLECFRLGQDFYSVLAAPVFGIEGYSMFKKDANSFATKHEVFRQKGKVFGLSATYGTTANKLAPLLNVETDEAQAIIDTYFEEFPAVKEMMNEAHTLVKENGYVENLFGRKRRIPDAMEIVNIYGDLEHKELPYVARNLLNLSVNHRIQSTGASIMNRAAIAFHNLCKEANIDAKIVMQIHDELVVECKEEDAEDVVILLKYAMENTVILPGVDLITEPKIGKNLAELK